ncbi:hypothetical protein RB257 [Rhodopirellula baltica SH 1]|uniref:Uncharacterized protein n=1 Tax=Rhodopirellula baltica (strain DSM 10527 / NCIMB 13988 / SH1) TaxID=243090 RepID=Q7UZ17_RHOBA|nr:hypothetical protein RB257 [Rhodopirellula baltica SH 1]
MHALRQTCAIRRGEPFRSIRRIGAVVGRNAVAEANFASSAGIQSDAVDRESGGGLDERVIVEVCQPQCVSTGF